MTDLEKKTVKSAAEFLFLVCDLHSTCFGCPIANPVGKCPAVLLGEALEISERTPEQCEHFGADAGSLYEYCHVLGLPYTRIDCCNCEQFKPREAKQ